MEAEEKVLKEQFGVVCEGISADVSFVIMVWRVWNICFLHVVSQNRCWQMFCEFAELMFDGED